MSIFNDIRSLYTPTFRFLVLADLPIPVGVFRECSIPIIEWETQEIKEGGLNTRVHTLPSRRKGSRLTLKNGVGTSQLLIWYIMAMEGAFNSPIPMPPGMGLRRAITVVLLNSLKIPVLTWHIEDALPVKWSGPQLKTDENSVAIQTLEFACGEVVVIPTVPLPIPGLGF